jgi:hypothetical protein
MESAFGIWILSFGIYVMRLPRSAFASLATTHHPLVIARSTATKQSRRAVAEYGDCHASLATTHDKGEQF